MARGARLTRAGVKLDPKGALAELAVGLKAAGTPARAKSEKAYLKSDLAFYGTAMPDLRRITLEYANAHPELDRRALRAIAEAAWKTDVFELRSAAVVLLDRRKKILEERDLPWLLDLVDASKTWALVDWLAATIIGDVVGRYPASLRWLPVWAKQQNFWIRRTALLAQLNTLKRGEGDWELFTRLAAGMLYEKEFFIRKAIGWVLREVSKKRPKIVYEFSRAHRDEMSGLTLREGAKYLSDAQRKALRLEPWRDREGKPYR
jgi:3-methyladenine DNA glycosylase AlkD